MTYAGRGSGLVLRRQGSGGGHHHNVTERRAPKKLTYRHTTKAHSNLLVRLTKEANESNISDKKYKIFADAISDVLETIRKYHGFSCMSRIIYIATKKLGS
jgi:hypothetical protein